MKICCFVKLVRAIQQVQNFSQSLTISWHHNSIEWSWCVGVCTDGAAAMTGKRTAGLYEPVRDNVPTATLRTVGLIRKVLQ